VVSRGEHGRSQLRALGNVYRLLAASVRRCPQDQSVWSPSGLHVSGLRLRGVTGTKRYDWLVLARTFPPVRLSYFGTAHREEGALCECADDNHRFLQEINRSREASKVFITTAIDYVNSRPHIGHAFEKVLGDTVARFHRLRGEDVWFLTGTDENATERPRCKSRQPPIRTFIDQNAQAFSISARPSISPTTASFARRNWNITARANGFFIRSSGREGTSTRASIRASIAQAAKPMSRRRTW